MTAPAPTALLLYCRPGFEGECAAEIGEAAAARGHYGYARAKAGSGYTLFVPHEAGAAERLLAELRFTDLIFPRQWVGALPLLDRLPVTDRLTPLLAALGERPVGALWLEMPDTNEGKALAGFCRKFAPRLEAALRERGLLREAPGLPRLHLFFFSSTALYAGFSDPANSAPWPLGIPRLKSPRGAPSRSTLKLEEALLQFLDAGERERRLRPGMRAVDLGAAPGGWSWQLVRRGLQVTAVDNGPMDEALMQSGLVEHRRADGFRYRPPQPVQWMVCDMVEQPIRVARLAAQWVAEGWCGESIFNLKLPMKRRWQEVQHCTTAIGEILQAAGMPFELRFKQLYHDREEVTGHLRPRP